MEQKYNISKEDLRDALSVVFNYGGAKLVIDQIWEHIQSNNTATLVDKTTDKWSEQVNSIYALFIDKFGRDKSRYKLSPKRRQRIIARLKDAGFETLEKAIINASNDKFYRGENDRGWVADLDYLTRSYEIVERLSQLEETSKVVEYSIYE